MMPAYTKDLLRLRVCSRAAASSQLYPDVERPLLKDSVMHIKTFNRCSHVQKTCKDSDHKLLGIPTQGEISKQGNESL